MELMKKTLDLYAINKIYDYVKRLKWNKVLEEYESLDYQFSEASNLVYIEWDDDLIPPLRKRLVNNGYDSNIYHVISKMHPSTAKIADTLIDGDPREIIDYFIVGKIPKRYKYSSGFNGIDGYKPSELDYLE